MMNPFPDNLLISLMKIERREKSRRRDQEDEERRVGALMPQGRDGQPLNCGEIRRELNGATPPQREG
ncbi:MAG: hypothetical protein HY347_11545 [candidate division NC10 bacterium]|nr:hypothetical protein [candidate division NC10 bacterium]